MDRKRKKLKNYTKLSLQFHLPTFITLTLITLIPLLYTLRLSFYDFKLSDHGSADRFVGFANYITLFQDAEFLNSMVKTFIFMFFAVVLETVIGILLALALNSIPFMRRLFTSLTLIPMMVAPLVIGLMFSFFINPQFGFFTWIIETFHLPITKNLTGDSFHAMVMTILMDVWEWAPYMGLIFLAGLQSISGEYYEAARVDGASDWQIFRDITLPLMRPVIAVGPGNATEVIDLYTYRQAFVRFKFSYAAAICVVLFVVLVICGMIYQKIALQGED